jgi:hypothetical protein
MTAVSQLPGLLMLTRSMCHIHKGRCHLQSRMIIRVFRFTMAMTLHLCSLHGLISQTILAGSGTIR